jgi:NAD(P)H dehydrogenase (quinone)
VSIIVTGASGAFGRKATAVLMEKVSPSELILVTRNPDSMAEAKARGATIRYGDFDEPESLKAAFAGGERILLISTMNVGRRPKQHGNAIDAAKAAGVRYLVYTSSDGLHPDNPAIIAPDHRATEALIKASGLDYTIMRDSLYGETPVTMVAPEALKTGFWRSPSGKGKVGFSAKKDCATCAATVLSGEGHEGITYAITGPEALTFRDACNLASETTGKHIEYVDISFEEFDKDLEALGIPEDYVNNMNIDGKTSGRRDIISYERGVFLGYFSNVSGDVKKILGREPTSLRQTYQEHHDFLMQFVK